MSSTIQTILVTGPRSVGPNYFRTHYKPQLDQALGAYPDCRFVLGDADGVDRLAQQYLHGARIAADRVTVHVLSGQTARLECADWRVDTSATTYAERDMAMARVATRAIAVLPQYGGGTSGSAMPVIAVGLGKIVGGFAVDAAPAVCTTLRAHAEPYDAAMAKFMAVFYEAFYASGDENQRSRCTQALAECLASR